MIEKNYKFPYLIHDGGCYGVKWEDDVLSMTICRYYLENEPNEIEIEFHGVEWIRSTCDELGPDGYSSELSLTEYPLVDREKMKKDYTKYVAYGYLDDIRCIDDGLVLIDDIMFFPCSEIRIIRAVCNRDIGKTERELLP